MALLLRARLLFGSSLLFSSITAANYPQALITLGFSFLTMVALNRISLLWRMLRYLRWLLLPIILLHLCFTPGMLLAPSLPWSPSQEGLDAALWQSLRLINWFLSGWLLAYLLSQREWQQLLGRLPRIGYHWAAIFSALPPLLQRCRTMLVLTRWRWNHERGRWRDITVVASAIVTTVLAQGAAQAEAHWLSRQMMPTIHYRQHTFSAHEGIQMALIAIGWVTVWVLW